MPESSNEFFSFDAKGRKVDAHLHEEILESPEGLEAQAIEDREIMARLRAEGMAESLIQKLYGG